MQRFNKLKMNLIERKDRLELAIAQATADEQYGEAVALTAKYEEVTSILHDMCKMKMEMDIPVVKERSKLRLVR